jgi:hypothetical protein
LPRFARNDCTVAGLMSALEACADIFKPAECKNYFTACGYDTA